MVLVEEVVHTEAHVTLPTLLLGDFLFVLGTSSHHGTHLALPLTIFLGVRTFDGNGKVSLEKASGSSLTRSLMSLRLSLSALVRDDLSHDLQGKFIWNLPLPHHMLV